MPLYSNRSECQYCKENDFSKISSIILLTRDHLYFITKTYFINTAIVVVCVNSLVTNVNFFGPGFNQYNIFFFIPNKNLIGGVIYTAFYIFILNFALPAI